MSTTTTTATTAATTGSSSATTGGARHRADDTTDRPAGALRVTQWRVIVSEWTKFRSLRSTLYTLAAAVVLMLGLAALVTAVTANQFDGFGPAEQALFDPVTASLAGITFAQLAFGVLGVLLFAGEYGTGMIRASMTAVPRRLPVLWAKLAVFAAIVATVSLVTTFGTFFLGQALLNMEGLGVSITSPGALGSVVGAAVYMTVAGMIGVAIGALVRSTAAGISTFVGAFFLLPPLMQLLPSSISDPVTPYLPSNAGASLYGGGFGEAAALSTWAGLAVLLGYAVVVIAGAAWRLQRSDV